MPWNPEQPTADERADFVAAAFRRDCPFLQLCRHFGISRKTGYKWLARADSSQSLHDRSRRPHHSPGRSPEQVERAILLVHDEHHWGARKVRSFLLQRGVAVPSTAAVHAVLRRHGRVRLGAAIPPATPRRFERSAPNRLWQMDFKGPLAGAPRPAYLLSVLDDHSRYLVTLTLCFDQTMATAWQVLWEAFGVVGLPGTTLSDNGFGPRGASVGGLSWLEARLLRLGVGALHGRPYHPQTQGKVERLHRTLEQEVLPWLDWSEPMVAVATRLQRWRAEVYNALRPHEALGNATPSSRWCPSERLRPPRLPEVRYPAGVEARKVMQKGEISWRGYELMVGAGLTGEQVGVRQEGAEVVLLYGTRELRRVPIERLAKGRTV